jgi:hypothetical protein
MVLAMPLVISIEAPIAGSSRTFVKLLAFANTTIIALVKITEKYKPMKIVSTLVILLCLKIGV